MDTAMPLSAADVAAVTRNNDGYGYGNGDGMGFGGGWWAIILFAMIFGWGGNGFGGRGNGEPVTESALCNSQNFNNLENAVGRLNDTVQQNARATDNAVCTLGYQSLQNTSALQRDLCTSIATLSSQIADCCCTTQRAIDSVNYNGAMNTAAINANTTAQTQKILDAICGNRMADMQSRIGQLELQQALCGVVRYPNQTAYYAQNPFFGCGCNTGCGCGNNI